MGKNNFLHGKCLKSKLEEGTEVLMVDASQHDTTGDLCGQKAYKVTWALRRNPSVNQWNVYRRIPIGEVYDLANWIDTDFWEVENLNSDQLAGLMSDFVRQATTSPFDGQHSYIDVRDDNGTRSTLWESGVNQDAEAIRQIRNEILRMVSNTDAIWLTEYLPHAVAPLTIPGYDRTTTTCHFLITQLEFDAETNLWHCKRVPVPDPDSDPFFYWENCGEYGYQEFDAADIVNLIEFFMGHAEEGPQGDPATIAVKTNPESNRLNTIWTSS